MAKYKVTDRILNITQSTTIMPERDFGGWLAVNQGTNTAEVQGFVLQPGEGLPMLDSIPLGSKYDQPINIVINAGAVVRLLRRQAVEIK